MTINSVFKKANVNRYDWQNLFMHKVGPVYAIVDLFDQERIVYCEKEDKDALWHVQQTAIKIIAERYNSDYLEYTKSLHNYVLSDCKQLTLPL